MTHAVLTRNLGRRSSWRKATVLSLTQALFKFERIHTTLAKAKETRVFAERLITLGRSGTLAARRQAIRLLDDSRLVARLFDEVAPRFASRPGGYTRLLHDGYRDGDGSLMAVLELVEMAPAKKGVPRVKEKAKGKAPEPTQGVSPAKTEEVKPSERPKLEKPQPDQPKKEEKKRERKEERPRGFLDGLRRLFKKDRPSP